MAVRAAVLTRLTAELWGASDVDGSGRHAPAGFSRHALVNWGGSLAVLPGDRRAAAEAMIRWTDATGLRDGSARALARLGFAAGGARLIAGEGVHIRVTSDAASDPTLNEYLASAMGAEVVSLSCAFGSMRPNRKPIVRIHGPSGVTLGFAKVGWNDLTRSLVDTEADFLSGPSVGRFASIVCPEISHRGTWRGRTIAVASPLLGRPRWGRRDAPGVATLTDLVSAGPSSTTILGDSAYVASLSARIQGLGDQAAQAYQGVLDAIVERWGAVELRLGRWHGDWTPWNMCTTGSRTIVWDWERTHPAVPVGFDAIHYAFHGRLAASKVPAPVLFSEAVTRVAGVLVALGQPRSAVAPVACLYALEMSVRFAEDPLSWTGGLPAAALRDWGER